MTTATLVTVLALVASSGDNSKRIDKGFVDGLRVGDQGRVYYELNVGGTKRRVDVAPTEITSVEAESSVIATDPERLFREGFTAEFQIPRDRISAASILAFAREVEASKGTPIDSETLQRLLPSDPETQELLLAWLEEQRLRRLSETAVREARRSVRTGQVLAGSYRIGLPAREARFYNQQPRFDVFLGALAVDRRPVSHAAFKLFQPSHLFVGSESAAVTTITYEQADEFCRWRGARLATEFEWEIAIQQELVTSPPGLLEWTASWYTPYPGNTRPEAAYGDKYRVLRGGLGGSDGMLDAHRRRFMEPISSSPEVGFRCVQSASG